MTSRYAIPAGAAVLIVAVLTGCAGATGAGAGTAAARSASLGALAPALPEGEVIGRGTVIGTGGDVELCLGPVQESYPPQCSGLPLIGWSWAGVDGAETSGDIAWGAYAVQGTYDGTALTLTHPPVMLALFDPVAREDPTGGRPGVAGDLDLAPLQEQLPDRLGADYLPSAVRDDRLWIDVVWEDGTYQDAADAEYGADVVQITSAL